MMIYAQAFLAAFMSAVLRGVQNKNIVGGYKMLTFITGALMYTVDAVTVVVIAKNVLTNNNYTIIAASAIGAGLGYVASMSVHRILTAKKEAELKAAKKAKDRKRVIKLLRELRDTGEL
ncbi:hypothetical protein [Achromobacter phage Motura]|uniref:Uncharacterized protein n=1 Tax=Achromobacter phage Motura TaxID=2591403 RepID=A0A514CSR4_9CAUD|nr:hypothetical protein H1O15_gp287 [Achromobacter phage Motura]QDH83519.1 hypothetical protein [Achromobacter phage Motura]